MSCGGGKATGEDKKAKETSQLIERDLKKVTTQEKKHMKLLLLGTGDAGKSTFAKQMNIIYTSGISDAYLANFIPSLRENALSGMQTILRHIQRIGEKVSPDLEDSAKLVLEQNELTSNAADAIVAIWKNEAFKEILARKAEEAQVQGGISGAQYYFENCQRFAKDNFLPTKEDLLKARRKTTGVCETQFTVGPTLFTMVDVGGQRSERKKWLHCFGSVSAVLFLTAINEFDMALEEDATTNRLVESLKLWKALTSSQFFRRTPFILFLNKSDLFREKLKKISLTDVFSDYESYSKQNPNMNNFEKGWTYLSKQYQAHFAGGTPFYPHLTCALDTDQCKIVFQVVQDTLAKEALEVAEFK